MRVVPIPCRFLAGAQTISKQLVVKKWADNCQWPKVPIFLTNREQTRAMRFRYPRRYPWRLSTGESVRYQRHSRYDLSSVNTCRCVPLRCTLTCDSQYPPSPLVQFVPQFLHVPRVDTSASYAQHAWQASSGQKLTIWNNSGKIRPPGGRGVRAGISPPFRARFWEILFYSMRSL